MSDEIREEHDRIRAGILGAETVTEKLRLDAAPKPGPLNTLAQAAAATTEALAREQEQRLQIEAEYAQRVADEQRLYLGLQLVEDGEHDDAVARIASDLRSSSPQLAEVLVQRWDEYGDGAVEWLEREQTNAARAAEYAPALAAIGESARRLKIEEEARQGVQTYTKTVGAEIKSRYADAEQVLAKADPQTVADALKALEERKVEGRNDPRVQTEAVYRWVKAHEDRDFANAVLNAGNVPSEYREPAELQAAVKVDLSDVQAAAYTDAETLDELARLTVASKTAVQDATRTLHAEATEYFDAERRKNDPRPVWEKVTASAWKPPKPRSQAELEANY